MISSEGGRGELPIVKVFKRLEDVKHGKRISLGRSLRKKLLRKSTKQRWGNQNHRTSKQICPDRRIHIKGSATTGCHQRFAKYRLAHRVALLLVRRVLPYKTRAREQSSSLHMNPQPRMAPWGRWSSARRCCVLCDTNVSFSKADFSFSWLLLLLMLLFKPVGRAAPIRWRPCTSVAIHPTSSPRVSCCCACRWG